MIFLLCTIAIVFVLYIDFAKPKGGAPLLFLVTNISTFYHCYSICAAIVLN